MNEVKEANMPKDVEKTMIDLFQNKTWAWKGMAEVFTKYNNPIDVDEFITCLKVAQKKRI